jgi:hypothetical protein
MQSVQNKKKRTAIPFGEQARVASLSAFRAAHNGTKAELEVGGGGGVNEAKTEPSFLNIFSQLFHLRGFWKLLMVDIYLRNQFFYNLAE